MCFRNYRINIWYNCKLNTAETQWLNKKPVVCYNGDYSVLAVAKEGKMLKSMLCYCINKKAFF